MRHGMVQTSPVFDAANDGMWMAPGPIGHLNADGAKNQSKPPKIFTASIIQKNNSQPRLNSSRTNKMKPFDYYSKPQTSYPSNLDYTTVFVYDKGEVIWSGAHSEYTSATNLAHKTIMDNHPTAVVQKVFDKDSFTKHRDRHNEESNRLHQEFISDLYAEFGVSDNPKKNKAFNLAWGRATANGFQNRYSDIYEYFKDLTELIKD
jgi:hypothetical protein